ncbi:very-long-chain aldehyde decarbonylase GL1-4-like isoform X2 [Magnolia sinica]|uniref:very-long-chain aldehyde decarbonylase GL1-4-like isoform X2 n=1 Tax=Magnolia sinica TaxID=86752 RepID=UPI0026596AB6|nr:very-long-chain aldehyde decarbonylase GL1-4-like isoform X2 [Magnolia sinica]
MASKPGPFTEWPWHKLGSFKYIILAPFVVRSLYTYCMGNGEKDTLNMIIIPLLLWRWLHNQIWISLARFQTARSKHMILHKSIEFDQVDREGNWDDQILLSGIVAYSLSTVVPGAANLPLWRTDGIVFTILLHAGPVEILYYWAHRALHHHFLYSRYHSHHHSSIVTEPITSVIHPFAEIMLYFLLFAIPLLTIILTGTGSISAVAGYITYIDFMNNMGHCNFELVPKWLFSICPPLKYFMYTPSFHSLHHTQFRTNYCLFMPIYDYIYGTMDKSSDALYEASLKGTKEAPHVVHLTHPTTLHSIYHLRLGIASLASKPYASQWYSWMLGPISSVSMLLLWIFGSTITVERNRLYKLTLQTWAIPRYSFQYLLSCQRDVINSFIEKAILEAEEKGVKVISLGLLNQGEEFNRNGELYLTKHPKLNIRIVDGSSLAVAIVLNSIPKGTERVLLRGILSKTSYAIALALCQRGIQIITVCSDEYEKLKLRLPAKHGCYLFHTNHYNTAEAWLVGDGLKDEEQRKAPRGTRFIPFSQFPPKRLRWDCIYHTNPAMIIPPALENMHACENWLPRRVMSACHVAGIVHALEGWDTHECGHEILDVEKVWDAALRHGFLPLVHE